MGHPSIYKVHAGLYNEEPKAYKPMLVSIGPYHIKDDDPRINLQLQAMQKHKTQYLNSFLKRRNMENQASYIEMLKNTEVEARQYYEDPIDLKSDEFVEMMLLDGCFIIEFFYKYKLVPDKDDPIVNVDWMVIQICRDLMLLENQLPYFVLSNLYAVTEGSRPLWNGNPPWNTWETKVMEVFNTMLPKPRPKIYQHPNVIKELKGAHHLLHAVHILCRPENRDSSETSDQIGPLLHVVHILCHPLYEATCHLLGECTENSGDNDEILDRMGSVVELQDAGVKFKKVGKTDNVSLFDIKFEHGGLMKVPCFKVEDSTETIFRNLIAYEQHSLDVKRKYFTDFATFMDQILNSEKDANLLRRNGIIVNLLGDDKKVSQLFNRLNVGVIESSNENFYYKEVRKDVNKHCKKKWNVRKAKLMRDYFNNPWAGISTFAAAVLLILTLAQTIIALITLFT